MIPRPLDFLGWIAAAVVVVGFCFPWLKFPPEETVIHPQPAELARLTADMAHSSLWSYLFMTSEDLEHARYGLGEGLNGRDLAGVYRDPRYEQEAMDLSRSLLLGNQRQVDRVIFAWAAPVFAAFAVMFLLGCRKRWALVLPWAACLGFYILVRFRLNATFLERFADAGPFPGLGLWLTLYGLLAMSIILAARIAVPNHPRF